MELVPVSLVTVLLASVALAWFDPSTAGFGALNLESVMSVLDDNHRGLLNRKSNNRNSDLYHYDGSRKQAADRGEDHKGDASNYGNQKARSSSKGNRNNRNLATDDDTFNKVIGQMNKASRLDDYSSGSNNNNDRRDGRTANGYESGAAKKKAFHTGKVFNDNVVYSFDKAYDQKLAEKGGFEEKTGKNANRLDEFRDKQSAKKFIKGDHSAAKARKDAVHAAREGKYHQNAAQGNSGSSKIVSSDKKLDKAGATQDAQGIQYDKAHKQYQSEDNGNQEIINKNDSFANKDAAFHRQAKASHAGAQGHDDKTYQGGHGNDGGLGHDGHIEHDPHGPVHKDHSGADVLHSGGGAHEDLSGGHANHDHTEKAHQVDQGKELLNQAAGASDVAVQNYKQAKKKGGYNLIKSLHDQRNGKFAQGVHNDDSKAYYSQDQKAAKNADGANRRSGDASAGSSAKAALHDLDENAFDKDIYKKNNQDRSENFKKSKRFFHDKTEDGKNFERLKYKRNRFENELLENQSGRKAHQSQFSKDSKSAQHNDDFRKSNFNDKKKSSNDFRNNKSNKRTDGHADNNANAYSQANQNAHGDDKRISESDFAKHRDSLSQNQRSHHDDSLSNSRKQSRDGSGRENYRSDNGGNRVSFIQGPQRLARPDFGADYRRQPNNQQRSFRRPSNFNQRPYGPSGSGNFGGGRGRHSGGYQDRNQGNNFRNNGGRRSGSLFGLFDPIWKSDNGNFGSNNVGQFGYGSGSFGGPRSFGNDYRH